MSMKRKHSEQIGDCRIIIAEDGETYHGIVVKDGRQEFSLESTDLEELKAALRNRAGKLHPDYFGIDGAKARFLQFFPEGFSDPEYKDRERDYKDQARAALLASAPVDSALEAGPDLATACKKGTRTNLLSRFEAARLNELLDSTDGPAFVRAAAAFTKAPTQANLLAMGKAIEPHGRPSWPLVTYFPYLWDPEGHMFLKPNATVDFAFRTGKGFAEAYDPALEIRVYEELLDMATETGKEIADLHPADRIDIQSFIWVVGSYTDEDAAAG